MFDPKTYPAPLGDILKPLRSSGSDHNKSHKGPSLGNSPTLFNLLILSIVSTNGDSPPCKQKN